MTKLIDYYTGAILATFNGTNARNVQLIAWITEHGYLVHHKSGSKLILIK